jgi:hypothetical protein
MSKNLVLLSLFVDSAGGVVVVGTGTLCLDPDREAAHNALILGTWFHSITRHKVPLSY